MDNYKCITSEFNSSTNSGYAKIITMRKSFLGISDYHQNQLLFRVVQAQSYMGYIERQYFISTIISNGSRSFIFKEMSNGMFENFKCIMTEDDNNYYIYVKGGWDWAPVKVYVDYSPNPALFEFHSFGLFNEIVDFPIEAKVQTIKKFEINWLLDWSLRTDRYSKFAMEDNKVTIDCVLKSGSVYDGICITKLPAEVRPKNNIIRYGFALKDSDGTYIPTRFVVLPSGDLIITKIDFQSTECVINISYDLDYSN